VIGTSTRDIILSARDTVRIKTVKGICGQVDGSVIPVKIGVEAGQSAFADVLAWFRDVLDWPVDHLISNLAALNQEQKDEITAEVRSNMIANLSYAAEKLPADESAPVALDWINGRRTPDANQSLKAAIVNLNLGTKAPHIFRALVEAICFGSKKIVERFQS